MTKLRIGWPYLLAFLLFLGCLIATFGCELGGDSGIAYWTECHDGNLVQYGNHQDGGTVISRDDPEMLKGAMILSLALIVLGTIRGILGAVRILIDYTVANPWT